MLSPEEEIAQIQARLIEPMTREEVELVMGQISLELSKLNRLCNLMLNRQGGFNAHTVHCLYNLKDDFSWLRWHIDNHRIAF